jgi:hypothetical protein
MFLRYWNKAQNKYPHKRIKSLYISKAGDSIVSFDRVEQDTHHSLRNFGKQGLGNQAADESPLLCFERRIIILIDRVTGK